MQPPNYISAMQSNTLKVNSNMLYLISYDIEKDNLRNKVAKTLEKAQLQRIQFSVFMGDLTDEKFQLLINQLRKFKITDTAFHIIFIPLHLPVLNSIVELGNNRLDWKYFKGEKDFLLL